jgi:HAMP domain-containing protein
MHRTMKDVALARNEADINSALMRVAELEQKVLDQFRIIEQRFLGEPGMYRRAETLFSDWKPIRDEVAALMRGGKYYQAAEITKDRGAAHVLKIVAAMNDLKNFAESKAAAFLLQFSSDQETKPFTIMYAIIGVTLLAGVILAVLIARSITRPAVEIAEVSRAIAGGDLTRRIAYQGLRRNRPDGPEPARNAGRGDRRRPVNQERPGRPGFHREPGTDHHLSKPGSRPPSPWSQRTRTRINRGRQESGGVFTDRDGTLAGLARTSLNEVSKTEADVRFDLQGEEVTYHAYASPLRT